MGYSTNFYLDNAISAKELEKVKKGGDKTSLKELGETIATKALQIFFYFRVDGRTIKIFSERKCRQLEWDSEKQRVNPRFFKEGSTILNNYLHNIEKGAANIYETNLEKKVITSREHFKALIDTLNNRENLVAENKVISMRQAMDEFVKDRQFKVTKQTISNFETTFKKLKAFSTEYSYELNYENINLKFESLFKDYLYSSV